ncbi:MAG TPA: xylulokinase [Bacillales bacterium]|nr:xylulokinase [Bacillales bacterium]
MKYVIGVDLGTSAVKVLLVNQHGEIRHSVSKEYPLIQEKSGFSEQNPEEWVDKTVFALQKLVEKSGISAKDIEGISFSGQMHGLVLLDDSQNVIRNAILWNDTRTTEQCHQIENRLGERVFKIAKNPALEGFTLPKLLWVKEYEPEHFQRASIFLLPKDYVRYRLTGQLNSEYSDAAGTLLLDVAGKAWSREICEAFDLDPGICPSLVASHECVGTILPDIAEQTGLAASTQVFAGGADNACGAVGSGILSQGETMCSIGTSGVVLSYEQDRTKDSGGVLHFFNHAEEDAWYAMGVTLGAGYSLNWFKETFAPDRDFNELLSGLEDVAIGSKGLLFTPYIAGERTPHADSDIRGSFIGIDGSHREKDFVRAVIEGITFSLNESIEIMRKSGQFIDRVISIGGGAKNEAWLQIQADVFDTDVVQLENEQGPGMGAAMLAAYGCGWFASLEACAEVFVKRKKVIHPIRENVEKYQSLFAIYQKIYGQTRGISAELRKLTDFR